jgi:pyruvate,water dikinase
MAAEPGHTRALPELRGTDEPRFGGKSAGLGELLAAGIPVPPGFALSATAFHEYIAQAGLDERIATALERTAGGDVEATAHAAHAIGETMRGAPVTDGLRAEIGARYAEVAAQAGSDAPPMAVRSSALGEDSAQATFAGQQETYLWVRGVDDICGAVRDCWASLYSTEAISYRRRLAQDGAAAPRPAMGVTVQLMADAAVSGVMFTCNPVSGDPSMVAINASWGLGLAVVGGEVTPDDYLVSKITREVVREQISTKQVQYVPAPGGRGTIRVEVEAGRRDVRCLEPATIGELVAVARRVQTHFGAHQDIEWAITAGGDLFVLQSRPVTAVATPTPPPTLGSAMSMVMSTFGARPREDA